MAKHVLSTHGFQRVFKVENELAKICRVFVIVKIIGEKNGAYLRQLVLDLKNTLKLAGAESVLRHETPCYRVDTSLIQCDYFSYLETGKPEFRGEYMMQYSWAEDTCAFLEFN